MHDLYDMHTPPWLLGIIVSYLSGRSMVMSHMGHTSSSRSLPGGGPQGTLLGGIMFMIKSNGAILRPPIPSLLSAPILKSSAKKVKFVDDGSIAVSINLKSSLVPDPVQRPKPLNFQERNELIFPHEHNLLQSYLHDTENFARDNQIDINHKKTKVITFNKTRKCNFPLEVQQNPESVSSQTKLVGVIVSDDLSGLKIPSTSVIRP